MRSTQPPFHRIRTLRPYLVLYFTYIASFEAMTADTEDDAEAFWRVGVCDSHCHPTDIMASTDDIASMNAKVLTVMSTRSQDQQLVADTASRYPISESTDIESSLSRYVVPSFGWHPWFSYQMIDDRNTEQDVDSREHFRAVLTSEPDDDFMESLPATLSLSKFLQDTEERLQQFPLALVGEIGLDRSFRLPYGGFVSAGDMDAKTGGSKEAYTPGSREGRPLSPHRVSLEHQKTILKAQFELAGKLRRPVSVHSVQTHGVVFDLLQSLWKGHEKPSKREQKRRKSASQAHSTENEKEQQSDSGPLPYPPRICMHSYSGPPEALSQFLGSTVPAEIYLSFSILINFSTPAAAKAEKVIKAIPDDKILIESDLHCAGKRMDGLLKDILLKVCEIKGWKPEDGARQLKDNWRRFVFGANVD